MLDVGGRLVYKLKVFLGYPRILDPNDVQTFEGGRNQKK
jgi:hypothetical protein